MRSLALLVLASVLAGVGAGPTFGQDPPSPPGDLGAALDRLAAQSGMIRDRLRVDPAAYDLENNLFGLLPLQTYLMREPERAPDVLEAIARDLAAGEAESSTAHERIDRRIELLMRLYQPNVVLNPEDPEDALSIRAGKFEADIETSSRPMTLAMERLYEDTGKRFQGAERDRVRRDEEGLGVLRFRTLAQIALVIDRAIRARDDWVSERGMDQGGAFGSKASKTARRLRTYGESWPAGTADVERLFEDGTVPDALELLELYRGAVVLARGLERWVPQLHDASDRESYQIEWITPRGRVAVGGSGENRYRGDYLLVVDFGGDDRYEGPGSVSGVLGASIVIDLAGNDRYAAEDSSSAGPGGAVLGYAAVIDRSGNDEYTGQGMTGGAGLLGVGWIHDKAGDDTYRGQFLSLGAGVLGMGLLVDERGSDRYELAEIETDRPWSWGQGFGGPAGIGLLLDIQGADRYAISGAMSELRGHLVQGAAAGDRGLRAGGWGLLVDGGAHGIDEFQAGSFAQGAAIHGGLGVLVDLGDAAGNYRAHSHSQGAGGTRALGVFGDVGGDDVHVVGSRGLGCGWDLGMGLFFDRDGADEYQGGEECLGASADQGGGWFLDLKGRDRFRVEGNGLGYVTRASTTSWRVGIPGVAVFIDLGDEGELEGPIPGEWYRSPKGGQFRVAGDPGGLGGALYPRWEMVPRRSRPHTLPSEQ